jgi:lipooligosaccharide transport system permease protein
MKDEKESGISFRGWAIGRVFLSSSFILHPSSLFPNPFSVGALRVWQRNRDAFLRLWKTELWPPFVEAVMTLLAFGFGLGVYVQQQVEGGSYLHFIAPGLVMSAVLFTAAFECMFGTYIRMKIEKMFDAIIATPISLEEVVSAEITWAATRASLTGSSVLIVLAVLQLVPSWWSLLMVPVALLTGFMIASLSIIVTALVPSINSYNYYITLGVIPMQLFSGIFFPVSRLPENVGWLVFISPLYPAIQLARALFNGNISIDLLGYVVWLSVLAVITYTLAVNLMRRRLIK